METLPKQFKRVITMACIGSVGFGLVASIVNYCAIHHGSSHGERSWQYSFIILQGIPLEQMLNVLGAVGLKDITSDGALNIVAGMADGLLMFLCLLFVGLVWTFLFKPIFSDGS